MVSVVSSGTGERLHRRHAEPCRYRELRADPERRKLLVRIQEARREDDPTLPQGVWEKKLKAADWRAVIGREYHAWDREHVVIDTAGRRIEDCVAAVMTALGDGAAR